MKFFNSYMKSLIIFVCCVLIVFADTLTVSPKGNNKVHNLFSISYNSLKRCILKQFGMEMTLLVLCMQNTSMFV